MSFLLFILFAILFAIFLAVFFVLRIFSFVIRPKNIGSTSNGKQKEPRFSFVRRDKSKKIFTENEGEYVDFEEIKGEKNDD